MAAYTQPIRRIWLDYPLGDSPEQVTGRRAVAKAAETIRQHLGRPGDPAAALAAEVATREPSGPVAHGIGPATLLSEPELAAVRLTLADAAEWWIQAQWASAELPGEDRRLGELAQDADLDAVTVDRAYGSIPVRALWLPATGDPPVQRVIHIHRFDGDVPATPLDPQRGLWLHDSATPASWRPFNQAASAVLRWYRPDSGRLDSWGSAVIVAHNADGDLCDVYDDTVTQVEAIYQQTKYLDGPPATGPGTGAVAAPAGPALTVTDPDGRITELLRQIGAADPAVDTHRVIDALPAVLDAIAAGPAMLPIPRYADIDRAAAAFDALFQASSWARFALPVGHGGADARQLLTAIEDDLVQRARHAGYPPMWREDLDRRTAYAAMTDEDLRAARHAIDEDHPHLGLVAEMLGRRGYDEAATPDVGTPIGLPTARPVEQSLDGAVVQANAGHGRVITGTLIYDGDWWVHGSDDAGMARTVWLDDRDRPPHVHVLASPRAPGTPSGVEHVRIGPRADRHRLPFTDRRAVRLHAETVDVAYHAWAGTPVAQRQLDETSGTVRAATASGEQDRTIGRLTKAVEACWDAATAAASAAGDNAGPLVAAWYRQLADAAARLSQQPAPGEEYYGDYATALEGLRAQAQRHADRLQATADRQIGAERRWAPDQAADRLAGIEATSAAVAAARAGRFTFQFSGATYRDPAAAGEAIRTWLLQNLTDVQLPAPGDRPAAVPAEEVNPDAGALHGVRLSSWLYHDSRGQARAALAFDNDVFPGAKPTPPELLLTRAAAEHADPRSFIAPLEVGLDQRLAAALEQARADALMAAETDRHAFRLTRVARALADLGATVEVGDEGADAWVAVPVDGGVIEVYPLPADKRPARFGEDCYAVEPVPHPGSGLAGVQAVTIAAGAPGCVRDVAARLAEQFARPADLSPRQLADILRRVGAQAAADAVGPALDAIARPPDATSLAAWQADVDRAVAAFQAYVDASDHASDHASAALPSPQDEAARHAHWWVIAVEEDLVRRARHAGYPHLSRADLADRAAYAAMNDQQLLAERASMRRGHAREELLVEMLRRRGYSMPATTAPGDPAGLDNPRRFDPALATARVRVNAGAGRIVDGTVTWTAAAGWHVDGRDQTGQPRRVPLTGEPPATVQVLAHTDPAHHPDQHTGHTSRVPPHSAATVAATGFPATPAARLKTTTGTPGADLAPDRPSRQQATDPVADHRSSPDR